MVVTYKTANGQTLGSRMSKTKFSVLRHNQEFLIVKETNGKSFVVATCYLEIVAERICELLQKYAEEKGDKTNEH